MTKSAFTLLFIFLSVFSSSAQRSVVSFNDGWSFTKASVADPFITKYDDTHWEKVNLPHCWNAKDPFDDDNDYYRGIGWYRKKFTLTQDASKGKKVWLRFYGANQNTDVYLNGAFVTRHLGGYTAFWADLTPFLKNDGSENVLAVKVINAPDPFVPPLDIGYAIYGGIYRDVELVMTDELHFATNDHGAEGVFVTSPNLYRQKAVVNVKAKLMNESDRSRKLRLVNTLYDKKRNIVATFSDSVIMPRHSESTLESISPEIIHPWLWSPEHPYLYTMSTRIESDGITIDELSNHLAFKNFYFDKDSGFVLNSRKYLLKGTNRHQDWMGKGTALDKMDHEKDLQLIKSMGCNFLRLAHYPQDPYVLKRADELGLFIWEEIPLVNYMNTDPVFVDHCKDMIREMIRQHYNYPSIILWGSMNEIFLNDYHNNRAQRITDSVYGIKVRDIEKELDALVRIEDPVRYSTIAMHESPDYVKYGIDTIPQVSSCNLYNGWYAGKVEEFGKILDKKHRQNPNQIIFVSEYGAESDCSINTENPERLDNTGNYQRYFHESYLSQINARNYLAGTAIWNQFDFGNPNIGGTISNINHKGMCTWDRKTKDVYYFYKANWNKQPMVYIASRDWPVRKGVAGDSSKIEIYSNAKEVSLYLNGKLLGKKKTNDIGKAQWTLLFPQKINPASNQLVARAKVNGITVMDTFNVIYSCYDTIMSKQNPIDIRVNCGAHAQYRDSSDNIWVEDKQYSKGSFGYIGGKPSYISLKGKITGTDKQPLIYSYIDSISEYRFDVPDGKYEVELFFAEPEKHESLVRIFNVYCNGNIILPKLDLFQEEGYCGTKMHQCQISVLNNSGISFHFESIKGKPIVNGIHLKTIQ